MTTTQHKEVTFPLPIGYVDGLNNCYNTCTMRMPCPEDETDALEEVGDNQSDDYYVSLLAKVIIRFESIHHITPIMIRNLYATDFEYLQQVYQRLKQGLPID